MKELFGKPFVDLGDQTEDQRIAQIVTSVRTGLVVAVCVDDEPDKIARYKAKLEMFGCRITAENKGPVAGVHTLQVVNRPS